MDRSIKDFYKPYIIEKITNRKEALINCVILEIEKSKSQPRKETQSFFFLLKDVYKKFCLSERKFLFCFFSSSFLFSAKFSLWRDFMLRFLFLFFALAFKVMANLTLIRVDFIIIIISSSTLWNEIRPKNILRSIAEK